MPGGSHRPSQTNELSRPFEEEVFFPLENGDRLSRVEFHRRYLAMPQVKKAELIEGVVYMPSPVSIKRHGEPHALVCWWIVHYSGRTPGTGFGDNATIFLDLDNEPQPDVFLRIRPDCGGQTRDTEDDFVEGAPELIVEVTSSSSSYDLHAKRQAYRRNGVKEYVVWLTREKRIDWWGLSNGEYVSLSRDEKGVIRSVVFPGLCLDVQAMLEGNTEGVLKRLEEGLATSEAATFRERLQSS